MAKNAETEPAERGNNFPKKRPAGTVNLSFAELPDWLPPAEARAFLKLSRTSMYELIRSKAIPSRKFGRLIRIPKSALDPSAK